MGLVESTDHVLAQWVVDGCFATHRRVHLSQQGGGHLDEGHAPHVAGGCETRHVANHTTTKRHQNGFAIAGVRQQVVKDQIQRLPVLVLLTFWQQYGADVAKVGRQGLAQRWRMER